MPNDFNPTGRSVSQLRTELRQAINDRDGWMLLAKKYQSDFNRGVWAGVWRTLVVVIVAEAVIMVSYWGFQ